MSSSKWYFVEEVFNPERFIEHILNYISSQLFIPVFSALESLIEQEGYFT